MVFDIYAGMANALNNLRGRLNSVYLADSEGQLSFIAIGWAGVTTTKQSVTVELRESKRVLASTIADHKRYDVANAFQKTEGQSGNANPKCGFDFILPLDGCVRNIDIVACSDGDEIALKRIRLGSLKRRKRRYLNRLADLLASRIQRTAADSGVLSTPVVDQSFKHGERPSQATTKRVIIGVLTTVNNTDRQRAIMETWATALPRNWPIYFLVAREGQPSELVGNTLYLDMKEAYENLPTKTHLFMRYCVQNTDFDYLLKCDDDTFFNPAQLCKLVTGGLSAFVGSKVAGTGIDATYHYGKCTDPIWNRTPCPGEHKGPYCAGGVGYFVNRQAAEIVGDPRHEEFFSQELYEDKAVGDLLRIHGIPPTFLPKKLFDSRPPSHDYFRHDINLHKILSAHPLSAAALREAWEETLPKTSLSRLLAAWLPLRRQSAA